MLDGQADRTDRQAGRQTDGMLDRQANRQTDNTDRQSDRQACRQERKQTDMHTQTGQTVRQNAIHPDRQTEF